MDSQARALRDEATPEQDAGARLEAFIRARWTRREGGIKGLAAEIGSSTETIYSWFRGDVEPNMGHLRALAAAIRVNRSEIVAVIDGDAEEPELADRMLALEETVAGLLRRSRTSPGGEVSPMRPSRRETTE